MKRGDHEIGKGFRCRDGLAEPFDVLRPRKGSHMRPRAGLDATGFVPLRKVIVRVHPNGGDSRHRGARAVWAARLKLRRGANVAAVALANKNARVLWALLSRGQSYRPTPFPARVPQAGG